MEAANSTSPSGQQQQQQFESIKTDAPLIEQHQQMNNAAAEQLVKIYTPPVQTAAATQLAPMILYEQQQRLTNALFAPQTPAFPDLTKFAFIQQQQQQQQQLMFKYNNELLKSARDHHLRRSQIHFKPY